MNWMIISTPKSASAVERLQEFFLERKAPFSTFVFSDQLMEAKLPEKKTPELTNLCELLHSATHCAVFAEDKLFPVPLFTYILGYLSGKDIPLFISEFKTTETVKCMMSSASSFTGIERLKAHLDTVLGGFLSEEIRQNAREALNKAGIVFTPDAFAEQIEKRDLDVCKLFADAGMNVNSVDSAGTPMLCVASRKSSKKVVEWLVNHGADINAVSQDRGYTPVMDAIWKSNTDIVAFLVQRGARLDQLTRDGQSVLVLATGSNDPHICEILAKNGADPFVKDRMGMSAYDYAKLFSNKFLISLFEGIKK